VPDDRGRRTRRPLRPLLVVLLALGWALALAAPAQAHAVLQSSNPADGSSVAAAPESVVLRFSEPVDVPGTRVQLFDGAGHEIDLPHAVAVEDGSSDAAGHDGRSRSAAQVLVRLPSLPTDQYLVRWSTITSSDFHLAAGTLVFGVGRPVLTDAEHAAEPGSPFGSAAEAALRWLALLGFACAVAPPLVAARLGGSLDRQPAARRRLASLAVRSGAVATSAVAALGVVVVLRAGAVPPPGFLLRWCVTVGGLGLATVLAVVRSDLLEQPDGGMDAQPPPSGAVRRSVTVVATGSLVAAAWGLAELGHGATTRPLGISGGLVASIHLASVAVWVGGALTLAAVVLPAWRERDTALVRTALRRFAGIAAPAVVVSATSGLLLAAELVPSSGGLTGSGYGRLLMAKVTVAALAAGAGGLTFWRLRYGPSGAPARGAGRPVARLIAETALLSLVVLLASGLAGGAPPTQARWAPDPDSPPTTGLLSADVDDLVLTLGLGPGVPGRNFVTVGVLDTRRPAPAPVGRVWVTVGSAAPLAAVAQEGTDWVAATPSIDASGRWPVRVTVEREGLPDVESTFAWVVAPAAGTEQGGRAIDSWLRWLALAVVLVGLAATLVVGRRDRPANISTDRPADERAQRRPSLPVG